MIINKLKSQKGSVTFFVLIAVIFFISIAFIAYASSISKSQSQDLEFSKIKSSYETSYTDDDIKKIHNEKVMLPTFDIKETEEILTNTKYNIQNTDIYNINSDTDYNIVVNIDGKQVQLPYTLDTTKVKTYEITYTIENSAGPITKTRKVKVYGNYTANNIITTNNFLNGQGDWGTRYPKFSELKVENKKLKCTILTNDKGPIAGTSTKVFDSSTNNHKFYFMIKAKVPSDSYRFGVGRATHNGVGAYGDGAIWYTFIKYVPGEYTITGDILDRAKIEATANDGYFGFYTTILAQPQDTSYIEYCLGIDLTKTFGEGNEPTKEWLNENIQYFETTQNIKYIID